MRDGALTWVYCRMTRGNWSLLEIQFFITDRSSYARIFFLLASIDLYKHWIADGYRWGCPSLNGSIADSDSPCMRSSILAGEGHRPIGYKLSETKKLDTVELDTEPIGHTTIGHRTDWTHFDWTHDNSIGLTGPIGHSNIRHRTDCTHE